MPVDPKHFSPRQWGGKFTAKLRAISEEQLAHITVARSEANSEKR
jgi:hypothetical protein